MSLYLFLNILIISIPLALSFESRVHYVRKWPAVFFSIITVGTFYILWDIGATAWGHWSFNPKFVGSARVFGLPVEEILFFGTTPFSCIFIYEVLEYFYNDKKIFIPKNIFFGIGLGFLMSAVVFFPQGYTFLVLVSVAAFFCIAAVLFLNILWSRNFWLYLMICYIPFLIFNGILTGLPVVRYHPEAIWGFRVFSIPLEDFFYNFSYLGFSLLAYKAFLGRIKK